MDERWMDDEDEFPIESIEPFGGPAVRIKALNGCTLVVQTDPTTRLTTLGMEDPDGELVASRVLGRDDLQRLVDALSVASEQAERSDVPVVVDVSEVIGRD